MSTNLEDVCVIISTGELNWCRLINVDESGYKIIGIEGNEIRMLSANIQGEILEEKLLYRLDDTMFYSIMDFKVLKDGVVAFSYVSEKQAGIIEIKDTVSKKYYFKRTIYCILGIQK